MTQMPTQQRTRVSTLTALFRSIARLMVDELIDRLDAAGYGGITAAQHLVFENIDPEGTRLTTLGARAGITRQSITELVTGLERNGYLELRPDPSDGRARLVCLTAEGKALVRRAIAEIAAIEAGWQESFTRAGLDIDLRELLKNAVGEHAITGPSHRERAISV
jgi:DNA-binding MarR family transcriptional regulator